MRASGLDHGLKRLKIEHLKKRALEDLQAGKFRNAYQRYTDALDLETDKNSMSKLYSNRSLAYVKALRFTDALQDAEEAIQLAPCWDKAHYRKGAALQCLKQHSRAACAFQSAWRLKPEKETGNALRHSVLAFSREDIADGLLAELSAMQCQGKLKEASRESATVQELREAAFTIVKASHQDCKTRPYHMQLLRWMKEGVSSIGEAYTQRAAIYSAANCFLQARADAASAINWYHSVKQGANEGEEMLKIGQALAHLRAGEAFMAKAELTDRDAYQAVKAKNGCLEGTIKIMEGILNNLGKRAGNEASSPLQQFARGLQLDAHNTELTAGLKEATELLSLEQLEQVQAELGEEGCQTMGCHSSLSAWQVQLIFEQVKGGSCSLPMRKMIVAAVAQHFDLDARLAAIEGIRQGASGLVVELALPASASPESAALQEELELGPDAEEGFSSCRMLIKQRERDPVQRDKPPDPQSNAIVKVPRPKLEISLPYRHYKLVTAEGRAVERRDKHPFCMSRVYYSRDERPEEVWAEDSSNTYRWRQSSSEVKVIALKVPASISAAHLAVTFHPFALKVAHRMTGEVFLEGRLERGIVPKECLWMLDDGVGEDGCLLLLHKMNLELFQKHWAHSESWWPKLFAEGAEIAWDDYEKDYSDLPPPVMAEHARLEGAKEVTRQLEAAEKLDRDRRQAEEDRRKAVRLERLNQMKPASFIAWSHLQNAIAACSSS